MRMEVRLQATDEGGAYGRGGGRCRRASHSILGHAGLESQASEKRWEGKRGVRVKTPASMRLKWKIEWGESLVRGALTGRHGVSGAVSGSLSAVDLSTFSCITQKFTLGHPSKDLAREWGSRQTPFELGNVSQKHILTNRLGRKNLQKRAVILWETAV